MKVMNRLAALDARAFREQGLAPSGPQLKRAVSLFILAIVLDVVLGLIIGVTVDGPDWVGPAVSGAFMGLASALIAGRLFHKRRQSVPLSIPRHPKG